MYASGSMCVKLGHLLYNQKKDEQSIPFYSQACDQLTLWCHGDPDVGCPPDLFASRMQEVNLPQCCFAFPPKIFLKERIFFSESKMITSVLSWNWHV